MSVRVRQVRRLRDRKSTMSKRQFTFTNRSKAQNKTNNRFDRLNMLFVLIFISSLFFASASDASAHAPTPLEHGTWWLRLLQCNQRQTFICMHHTIICISSSSAYANSVSVWCFAFHHHHFQRQQNHRQLPLHLPLPLHRHCNLNLHLLLIHLNAE